MTRFSNRLVPAVAAFGLATVIGAGAALAAVPQPMNDQADPGEFTWVDNSYQTNLNVTCDIEGAAIDVGSFEICDLAGGTAVSAEV